MSSSRRHLGGVASALLASVLLASSASAQTSEKALAESLFREGRKLMAEEQYDQACDKLAESQRLDPNLSTLLNLAGCYELAGRSASAWVTYGEAKSAAREAGRADREALAIEQMKELEEKLSTVTISVSSPVEGTVVAIDEVEIASASFGIAFPVDPGEHVLTASAPGHTTWKETIVVAAGPAEMEVSIPALEPEEVVVAPPPSPPSPPSEAPDTSGGLGTQGWIGVAALSVGVVGVGIGSAFGVMTMGTTSDVEDECDGPACSAEGLALHDDATTQGAISTVAFIAGGVAIAAGAVLLLTAPSSPSEAGVTVAAIPGPGGFSMRADW